jgi:hypothetical protein
MSDDPKYTEAFTLVFEGDIRKFKMNPLTTETPWGVPYAVMLGDALEQLDEALGEGIKPPLDAEEE